MAIMGALGLESFDAKSEAPLEPVLFFATLVFSTGHTVESS
jgi:hypothetical protein